MLVNLLKDEAAPVYLLRLWAHCQNRKTVTFENLSNEALKALCRFPGHANQLESSLAASGFVRRDDDGSLNVLGWAEYNQTLIAAWANGRNGGRPKKPTENPRVTDGYPTGNPRRTDKRREDEIREEKIGEDEKEPPNPLPGESGRKRPAKAPPFDPLKVDLPPSLESPEFRAAWADWMRHRMEIKKPYKPLGVEKLLEQLAAMGAVRSIAAINYSIANQWQGVFEPKSSDPPAPRPGAGSDPRGNISVVEEYLRDRRA